MTRAPARERMVLMDELLTEAADEGLLLQTADDERLDGRTVGLAGRSLLNFGSCSYLGLELDPRMREAVCAAVMRYGTQFSSSRSYVSAPPYPELEAALGTAFGASVLVAPTTSLAHIAALPVLVEAGDAVVLDQQVHHSVQVATSQLRVQGTTVEVVRHSDLGALDEAIGRLERTHRRVWYLADGVYSMFADLAPFAGLRALLDRHESLWLYIDDSHGVGWTGRHGRGPALQALGGHERLVVAASLNKSFASAGGALVFPDAELARLVRTVGGPMMFSGPVPPPMLGAALCSVGIHLTPEIERRQAALRERIDYCTTLMTERGLPLASADVTPIRYLRVGLPADARAVASRLLARGIFANVAIFPAVPMKEAGVRLTLTVHHRPADIRRLVDALAEELAPPAPAPRAAPAPALRLEHHRSIAALDAAEWDALLGDRGTFDAAGLRFLEQAFGPDAERPEDRWTFHYYVVRDGRGVPVLATFFTAALWKDDMLSPAPVSARVEALRATDPYHLTSLTFGMGSLLTEGDHLHLDRDGPWRDALALLLGAVAVEADRAGADPIVLRDLGADDAELEDAIAAAGFARTTMPDSLVVDPVHPDDERWLAALSQRGRVHQRREVLAWEDAFTIEVLDDRSRTPSEADLAHLHALYLNVLGRGHEINTFALPPWIWRSMLAHPCWELVLLSLDGTDAPVAFGAHFKGRRHYAPMVVGLDYAHVRSHHSYRQALRQALLRARVHGAERMLLGMGASLEKRRFGARAQRRRAYVQSTDHYAHDVLASIEADASGRVAVS